MRLPESKKVVLGVTQYTPGSFVCAVSFIHRLLINLLYMGKYKEPGCIF